MSEREVAIFDTTLRDGEQAAGASMSIDDKVDIAIALEDAGVAVIEAGFPASNGDAFETVRKISDEVGESEICVLARSTTDDIDEAVRAISHAQRKRIHVFIGSSDRHLKKLNISKSEAIACIEKSVSYAHTFVQTIQWSPEDATRTDRTFLFECIQTAVRAGASIINIPDTVGYIMPSEYEELIRAAVSEFGNRALISVHCHDDLGNAVANTLSGIRAGAHQAECTVNGIGERAGNAALEEVVAALDTRFDYFRATTSVNTTHLKALSGRVAKASGFPVPKNKAIVGENAFAHESGIHQAGVIQDASSYEIMVPERFGNIRRLPVGKLSGRRGFCEYIATIGIDISETEMSRAFVEFKRRVSEQKVLTDDDIRAIIASVQC